LQETACRSQPSAFSRYWSARDWIEASLYRTNGRGVRLFRAQQCPLWVISGHRDIGGFPRNDSASSRRETGMRYLTGRMRYLTGRTFMSSRKLWLFALVCALCQAAQTEAAPFMIVGNDEKIVWDDAGKPVLSPAGKDSILIVDLANPLAPKIVTNLQLKNSVVGPPVNLAIDPTG